MLRRSLFYAPKRSIFTSTRCLASSSNDKNYSATLLLPKTDFPLRHKDAVAAEMKFRDLTTDGLYKWQEADRKGKAKAWVLNDGPPYANGNLHVGHALNKILKDFINRYKLLRGHRINYIPGWDCHGLPIEHKALKALGKTHRELSPMAVRQTARETALDAIETQKSEFRQLGVMADWDGPEGTYRTLDHAYEMRQLDLFKVMVEKGYINHRLRPTYYSPSSRTALAEAELSYKDGHKSRSVYVAFPVEETDMSEGLRNALSGMEGGRELSLAVWTTTPWTLPANMGVTINPELEYAVVEAGQSERLLVLAVDRIEALHGVLGEIKVHSRFPGSDLIGTRYTHLFQPESSTKPQVFAAKYVTSTSGTGLVHTAPAHGQDDYEAFRIAFPDSFSAGVTSPKLRCPVDDDGKFTSALVDWAQNRSAAENLVGLSVLGDGVGGVIDMLEDDGCLLAEEEIEHRYPCDWKTKEPIIVRATPQWFADIDAVKARAMEAMDDIKFHPEKSRKRLESFVMGRSEWCISRQRSWGLPIPAIYDVATGEPTLSTESLAHIITVLQEKGTDHWWSDEVDEFVPPHLRESGRTFRKGTDTMDVWFDSGSSWKLIKDVMAGERPASEPLADAYLEGSDQHRGWFQSSLLTRLSEAKDGEAGAPFTNLITHGFVLDESGTKMSKSLGNTLSPMEVINGGQDRKKMPAYGSDTLRMWAAFVEYSRDVSIGPSSISQSAEVLRKLRNTVRFLIANTAADRENQVPLADVQLSLIDRYVLHEVAELEKLAIDNYDIFIFNRIVQAINTFTTTTLSAFYFDVAKDILYADAKSSSRRQAVIAVLQHTLDRLTKIIAPVVPHLAEEIHATATKATTSVFADVWTPEEQQWLSPVVKSEMGSLLAVRDAVMSLVEEARAAKHLKLSQEAMLAIETKGTSQTNDVLLQHEGILPTLFGVSEVTLHKQQASSESKWQQSAIFTVDGNEIRLLLTPSVKLRCPRCWLHTRQNEAETLCIRCADVVA